MSGNSIGRSFCLTTFGESHGPGLGAIVDGCPPDLKIDQALIQRDLDRRRPGRDPAVTARQESDQVEILSGIFEGRTTGTPIGLLIRNQGQRSQDYDALRHQMRPGHADFTYLKKYGRRDHRGGGRASARETAMRVAGGAIARAWLAVQGVQIRACVTQVGTLMAQQLDWEQVEAKDNGIFFADGQRLVEVRQLLDDLRQAGDSCGAAIKVQCLGVPAGLGEPVFDKLDAALAGALMSINAVKAIAFGDGSDAAAQRGSDFRDPLGAEGHLSNHAGGIIGGISNGEPIEANLVFKPTSSVQVPVQTLDATGKQQELSVGGRHDPCVALRAVPIVEAMTALTLCDHWLRQQGQNAGWKVQGNQDSQPLEG